MWLCLEIEFQLGLSFLSLVGKEEEEEERRKGPFWGLNSGRKQQEEPNKKLVKIIISVYY